MPHISHTVSWQLTVFLWVKIGRHVKAALVAAISPFWSYPHTRPPLVRISENVSRRLSNTYGLWDGEYGFQSLSEKTWKFNHFKMCWQRQHFLLSFFETLSVGPAMVRTRDPSRMVVRYSTNWTTGANIDLFLLRSDWSRKLRKSVFNQSLS